ncbi:flavodoxin family protein [Natronobacterium gregoryi]|uniref:Uncharacterized protein n=2 Tax=Natronobacterium gregoryi TaxID=44930 RepID=L0AI51_NATGS|nr:flavodoxin family protein [Natronobacterium gregoryi]AFZ73099.1 hypothetical protein Natgr_1915 [Natronobacterium gregoryi SP2]ELY70802.1 hypothetical protein C490_05912 [Natronobacterium gregoryi SP2]PLK20381.1 hypothetical protein CYV19_09640 [Natronobacterium gregoryi SP2]SFI61193.1 menaquinone-dependent protoporphyrinogen oxidase [Natronobacterium gregoryi]
MIPQAPVAHSASEGQTETVAERIGEILESDGHDVIHSEYGPRKRFVLQTDACHGRSAGILFRTGEILLSNAFVRDVPRDGAIHADWS